MKKIIRRVVKEKHPTVTIPSARSDCTDFFAMTQVVDDGKNSHNQFLVFVTDTDGVTVHIVDDAKKLCRFPPSSMVITQWPGKYRSDWFKATIYNYMQERAARGYEETQNEDC